MVINFGAGPAKLPEQVLADVQRDLIGHGVSGMSVMEMSHRGADYAKIHDNTIERVRELLDIPANYKVLLLQGGGTAMFASVCMNLMGASGCADYIVTGSWSAKAAKEATKYGKVNLVIPKMDKYNGVPADTSKWSLDPKASYVYYCDNETVEGVEFSFVPDTKGVPLVVDMSSNILTRHVDVKRYGLIYAGAQKNIGPAGITLVIVRDDLIGKAMPITPLVMDYAVMAKDNSLHNTPPTFIIYVMGEVFEWIKQSGGVDAMQKLADTKSQLIYNLIEKSNQFYVCPTKAGSRSRVNIPFRIGSATGDDALEKKFLCGAEERGMVQLKGHRSVGGIRASLYNAVTVDNTKSLEKYMREFMEANRL